MDKDNSFGDRLTVTSKTGGGGTTGNRSGRQRAGASRTATGAFKANSQPPKQRTFTSTDRRSRSPGILSARRALNKATGGRLGGTTRRARVNTRNVG